MRMASTRACRADRVYRVDARRAPETFNIRRLAGR